MVKERQDIDMCFCRVHFKLSIIAVLKLDLQLAVISNF